MINLIIRSDKKKPTNLNIDIILRCLEIPFSYFEHTIFGRIYDGTIIAPTRCIELHLGIGVVIRFFERIYIIQLERLVFGRIFPVTIVP